MVTASGDKTARLWDASSGKAISPPMEHYAVVCSAAFSPDGQRVVTASCDKRARLWDASSGKAIGLPMQHDGEVVSAAFSPDGQLVVTASYDKTARLWDAASGKAIGLPMQHDGDVGSAAFSPDGQRVVTASDDSRACVWDIPTIRANDTPEDILLLADLAEASGGLAVQTSGEAEILNPLTAEEVKAIREKITAKFAGETSALTPLQRLLKWSVGDRKKRTISPFCDLTVPEWIENRISEGTVDGLRATMVVDPTNARLEAYFAKALADYALKEVTDLDEVPRAAAEAAFQSERALKLASDNVKVKKLCAEVAARLGERYSPRIGWRKPGRNTRRRLPFTAGWRKKTGKLTRAEIERTWSARNRSTRTKPRRRRHATPCTKS